jgi:hypothetical protein
LLVALPTVNILQESLAAAATPALVRSGSSQGTGGVGSTVAITASLGATCNAGDTLIAMVTIAQQNSAGGMVAATPPGWRRIYEHSAVDISPYQGWFALPGCSGVSSASFSISAPGNSSGVQGSVILDEFSGLPNPVVEDSSENDGNASAVSSESLPGPAPAASGELVLTALSLNNTSSASTSTPSGWGAAGSEGSTLPAFAYYQVANGSTPSANFTWSPSSAFEVTMLALKAGPSGAPNVVQETQGAFSGASGSVTLSNGVSAGDALVALVGTDVSGSNSSGFEASTISGGGVTWQQVSGYSQSGNGSAEVWVGLASSGTSGATQITASMKASVDVQMVVSEVSGIDAVDTSASNHGTSSSPTAASINPQSGDFLVGLLTANSTSVVTHPQPNWSTYSLSASSNGAEWQTNVPSGSSTPQWSTNSSSNWVTVQAAFLAGSPPPAVTELAPTSGPSTGGTSVSIIGSNLTGATAVDFGATPAASFAVNSSTFITATAPAASAGTVDVTVRTAQGTSATSGSDHYTFVAGGSPPPSGGGTSQNPSSATQGYWMVGSDGGVFAFGDAGFVGSLPGIGVHVNDIVAVVPTSTGKGYWMVGADGGVFAFGDAGFVGSLPGIGVHVNDIVAVVPTSTGKGYWMVGADGGVFAFGDAGFVGSLPGIGVHVNDIVAVVPTSTGKGYWMVGADGGVFAFGDAGFVGSLPGMGVHVNDIVGVVPTSTGKGYWMVGKDGGVFAFGNAGFVGSLPGDGVHVSDVVGVVATPTGKGYWMIGKDGGVFAFGDAGFVGSLPGIGVHLADIVAVVPTSDSKGYWMVGSDGGVFAFGDAGFVGSLPGIGVHVNNIVAVVPT